MRRMMMRLVAATTLAGMLAGCVAVIPVPLGETRSEAKTATKQKS